MGKEKGEKGCGSWEGCSCCGALCFFFVFSTKYLYFYLNIIYIIFVLFISSDLVPPLLVPLSLFIPNFF